jgi:hypothetical protein
MNNFNMSNTGLNVEVNIGYDQFMSQINFDENIDLIDIKNNEYFIYSYYGNIDTNIDLNDLFEFDLMDISLKAICTFNNLDINNCDEDDRISLIEEFENYQLSNLSLEEIEIAFNDLEIEYKKLYDVVSISGYNQRDNEDVIILTDQLKKVWGVDNINMEQLKTQLEHYFYDAPVIVWVTINDHDLYLSLNGEYLEWNELEYNKEDVIDEIIDQAIGEEVITANDVELLRDELVKLLPVDIEW